MSINCPKCTKLIRKNQNSITCYFCENSFHLICENVSTELYNLILTEKNTIFWDCSHCRDESKELRNQNKELQVENLSLKTDNKSLKNSIYALESNEKHLKETLKNEILSEIRETVAVEIQEMYRNTAENSPKDIKDQISEALKEERDREKRQGNLCIRGMHPSDSSDGDKKAVLNLFHSVLGIPINEHSGLTNVKRIGEGRNGIPTLMIASFSTMDLRRKVLQNAYKLKDYETPENSKVYI